MFLQGMLGMHRRWYDGGQGWTLAGEKVWGMSGFRMERADLDRGLDHGPRANSVHHQFLLEHQAREESERQSLGGDHAGMDRALAAAAREFRHDAGGLSRPVRIQPARAARPISRCKTNRCARAIAKRTKRPPPSTIRRLDSRHGNSVHSHRPARHRALERQGRHLAFSRLGSHALRRTFLRLHFSAARRRSGRLAARLVERAGRHDEHRDPDRFVGHGGDGLGFAEDATSSRATSFTWRSPFSAASSFSR